MAAGRASGAAERGEIFPNGCTRAPYGGRGGRRRGNTSATPTRTGVPVVESRVSEDRGAAEVVWRHAGENIVSNRVPSDETRTAPDKPEQHRVVRLSFECSSGERTPDVPRVLVRKNHNPPTAFCQRGACSGLCESLQRSSQPIAMTVPDLDSDKHGQSESL